MLFSYIVFHEKLNLKSTQMTKEYGMYRQNYCGCMFSYEEMLKREEHKVEQKQDA